jgi:anti-anti-sigma regulatory factor
MTSGHSVQGSGASVVSLPEEITFSNTEQVALDLLAAISRGVSAVVADGTSTMFCDSAGMRELVTAHKRAAAIDVSFRVAASRHLQGRLERSGLGGYLPIYSSLPDAVAAADTSL